MSQSSMKKMANNAKEASQVLATLSSAKRNAVLKSMASYLVRDSKSIQLANAKDLKREASMGLSKAMISRLQLNDTKIKKVAEGLIQIMKLPNPLGQVLEKRRRPNGLAIKKVSVPLGVILIIFESRPNVTADCAGLCVKSGNSVILRGGKEAFYSNQAIHKSLTKALALHGVPKGAVSFVNTTDRSDVGHLLQMKDSIDVVIPRGGKSLIHRVAHESSIPVIKHYDGICHTYVDAQANLNMALAIAENAKVQSPGVCNAMETLLVHEKVAKPFLIPFGVKMKALGVELRGCPKTIKIIPGIKKAKDKDWATEYLDLILSIRVVKNIQEAISHIRQYGSGHSDTIVSQNKKARQTFLNEVDSSCVLENASTRFNDGGQFGMGAEMGISTDKLHARGPVGLRELTSYKYIVSGRGQIRNS